MERKIVVLVIKLARGVRQISKKCISFPPLFNLNTFNIVWRLNGEFRFSFHESFEEPSRKIFSNLTAF